jgi:hypothetical protein
MKRRMEREPFSPGRRRTSLARRVSAGKLCQRLRAGARACLLLVVLCPLLAGCWSTCKSRPEVIAGESTVSMLESHNLPTSTRNDLHRLPTPFRWAALREVKGEVEHFAKYDAMPVHWRTDLLVDFDLPPGASVRPGHVYISNVEPDRTTGVITTVEIDLPDEGGFTLAIVESRDEHLIPAIVVQERLRMMSGGRSPSAGARPLKETPSDGHFSLVYESRFYTKRRDNEGMIHLARRFEIEGSTYVALVEWRRSQAAHGTREDGVLDGCLTILNGIRLSAPDASRDSEAE